MIFFVAFLINIILTANIHAAAPSYSTALETEVDKHIATRPPLTGGLSLEAPVMPIDIKTIYDIPWCYADLARYLIHHGQHTQDSKTACETLFLADPLDGLILYFLHLMQIRTSPPSPKQFQLVTSHRAGCPARLQGFFPRRTPLCSPAQLATYYEEIIRIFRHSWIIEDPRKLSLALHMPPEGYCLLIKSTAITPLENELLSAIVQKLCPTEGKKRTVITSNLWYTKRGELYQHFPYAWIKKEHYEKVVSCLGLVVTYS